MQSELTPMFIPSFAPQYINDRRVKPAIYALEVRRPQEPSGGVTAIVLIERTSRFRRDDQGQMFDASVCLSYMCLEPRFGRVMGKGKLSASYAGQHFGLGAMVCLTNESIGKGAVFFDPIELRGHRIGSYLMNELVAWCSQWPEAGVFPIELLEGQAHPENKERRNRFYEQFGIRFKYTDASRSEGMSEPIQVRDLIPLKGLPDNLRELGIQDTLSGLLTQIEHLQMDVAGKTRGIESLERRLQTIQAHPIRWALDLAWAINSRSVYSLLVLLAAFIWGCWKYLS